MPILVPLDASSKTTRFRSDFFKSRITPPSQLKSRLTSSLPASGAKISGVEYVRRLSRSAYLTESRRTLGPDTTHRFPATDPNVMVRAPLVELAHSSQGFQVASATASGSISPFAARSLMK